MSKTKKLSIAVDLLNNDINGIIRKIPIQKIVPSNDQPRLNKDVNIEKLSKSLIDEGLLQPIVVTKNKDDSYLIIAGERRFRAAALAGWTEIECKILNKNVIDTYRIAVIENLQRENLNPIEESLAYKKLKEMFAYTDQQLAEVIGKSRNYINEILSISDIPENLREVAYNAGIKSRNLLVQFSQAVKNNCDRDFLLNFQRGEISTVKSAKGFLQNAKETKNTQKKTKQSNFSELHPLLFNINTTQNDAKNITFEIKIEKKSDISFSSQDFEKFFKKYFHKFIASEKNKP